MVRQGLALSWFVGGSVMLAVVPCAFSQGAGPRRAAAQEENVRLPPPPPPPPAGLRVYCDSLRAQLKAPVAQQVQYTLFESPPGAPIGWGAMYFQDKLSWYGTACPLPLSDVNTLRVALGLPKLDAPPAPPAPEPVPQGAPPSTPPSTPATHPSTPVAHPPAPVAQPPMPQLPRAIWPSRDALISNQLPPGVPGEKYQHAGSRTVAQLKTDRDFNFKPAVPLNTGDVVDVYEVRRPVEGAAGTGSPGPVASRKYVVTSGATGAPRFVRVVVFTRTGTVEAMTDHDLRAGSAKTVRGTPKTQY